MATQKLQKEQINDIITDEATKVIVQSTKNGIGFFLPEHGMYALDDDFVCSQIWLESKNGEFVLYVWADINEEEPTHIIDLSGARISRRQPMQNEEGGDV